jgi:membrane protein
LLAIGSALLFGLGLGRVLQLVHARAWQITLRQKGTDRARYAAVLLGLYALIFVLLAQLDIFGDRSSWVDLSALPLWVALLTAFFTWSPRFLTHKQAEWRDLLPSAVLTAVGLVVLMVISTYVMQLWVDFYAQDYGGLGVVMAIFFWIELSAGIIVWAASLSPALAERRRRRQIARSV